MWDPHRQAIHASYKRRDVMQQVVKQTIGISSKSTHKLSKKYDNHDEYLRIINSMLKGD